MTIAAPPTWTLPSAWLPQVTPTTAKVFQPTTSEGNSNKIAGGFAAINMMLGVLIAAALSGWFSWPVFGFVFAGFVLGSASALCVVERRTKLANWLNVWAGMALVCGPVVRAAEILQLLIEW